MMVTIKEWESEFHKSKEVSEHFMMPINDILLKLELVTKEKARHVPLPYVKAEILIPHAIGTSIGEVLKSDWKLALLGVKYKKVKR